MGLAAQMVGVYVLALILTDFALSTEPITGPATQKGNRQYKQSENLRNGTKMATMREILSRRSAWKERLPKYRCPSKTFPASPVFVR